MPVIVCAVRGGEESKKTIDRAVEMAAQTRLPLYFLYVVNLDFLAHATTGHITSVREEMFDMGEFILAQAKSDAQKQGVAAHGVVREGQVGTEITALSKELDARYIIIGSPLHENENNVFTVARFMTFVKMLEEETGAEVVLAGGDGE